MLDPMVPDNPGEIKQFLLAMSHDDREDYVTALRRIEWGKTKSESESSSDEKTDEPKSGIQHSL
ncbi:MAG: hypothetical protein WC477_02925 [Patescibacteria group bacterium]